MTDLEAMSTAELKELAKKATELAEKKRDKEKHDLRTDIEDRIRAAGYTVDEIFPRSGSAKPSVTAKGKAPAKYMHPENPTKTWSGRGRKPKWVLEAEGAGQPISDFLIERR